MAENLVCSDRKHALPTGYFMPAGFKSWQCRIIYFLDRLPALFLSKKDCLEAYYLL